VLDRVVDMIAHRCMWCVMVRVSAAQRLEATYEKLDVAQVRTMSSLPKLTLDEVSCRSAACCILRVALHAARCALHCNKQPLLVTSG